MALPTVTQNPAPMPESGQETINAVRQETNAIMARFMSVLPSNYVSQVTGPFYTLQFQAAAEQLAAFVLSAQEVYQDNTYSLTRSDFIWEILGTLVFPSVTNRTGMPQFDSDTDLRTFLQNMVVVLLKGATKAAMQEGVQLLTDAEVTVIESYLSGITGEQFTFEITAEGFGTTSDPVVLTDNVKKIMAALKPAHALYTFRFLFREVFGPLFTDTMSWDMSTYEYDDFRGMQFGTKQITGTAGVTLPGRNLFSDPTRNFNSVQPGGNLTVTAGVNQGVYRVTEVRALQYGADSTGRAYTTSPSGLSGTATVALGVAGAVLTDATQDWSLADLATGEILTFTTGPNSGASYRLDTVLSGTGRVKLAPSILKLVSRMPVSLITGQPYTVDCDRLGRREPVTVTAEDCSEQFWE